MWSDELVISWRTTKNDYYLITLDTVQAKERHKFITKGRRTEGWRNRCWKERRNEATLEQQNDCAVDLDEQRQVDEEDGASCESGDTGI